MLGCFGKICCLHLQVNTTRKVNRRLLKTHERKVGRGAERVKKGIAGDKTV
jgi:hypothetical protein